MRHFRRQWLSLLLKGHAETKYTQLERCITHGKYDKSPEVRLFIFKLLVVIVPYVAVVARLYLLFVLVFLTSSVANYGKDSQVLQNFSDARSSSVQSEKLLKLRAFGE